MNDEKKVRNHIYKKHIIMSHFEHNDQDNWVILYGIIEIELCIKMNV